MTLFWLLLGPWRFSLGGALGKIPQVLLYLAALAIVCAATWSAPWQETLVDGIGVLFLARAHGHGPMLTIPIKPDPDGDWLYEGVRFRPRIFKWQPTLALFPGVAWIGDDELRWWAYALLRYPGFAAAWAVARMYVGVANWELPIAGAAVIVLCYRILWTVRGALPHFRRPGDQVQNWTELCGWSVLGALLAFV